MKQMNNSKHVYLYNIHKQKCRIYLLVSDTIFMSHDPTYKKYVPTDLIFKQSLLVYTTFCI